MSPFGDVADFWAAEPGPSMDDYTAWELRDCPRHGDPRKGWPKIRRPDDPTQHRFHLRASQLGGSLEDVYMLHLWELRAAAIGMAYDTSGDLRERALSVPNTTIKLPPPAGASDTEWQREWREAKGELEDVAFTAARRAGADRRATTGTVVHRLYPRYRRGDRIDWPNEQIETATLRVHELHQGLAVYASEQFVAFDDEDGAAHPDTQVLAAGTFDELVGPEPGYVLVAPDGTILSSEDRIVDDLKTGDGKVTKADYCTQPLPYVRGRPYTWAVSDEQARDGDSGRRDWPEGKAPHQRWALIMHVPIGAPEDAGLVWVDVDRSLEWARCAAGIRAAVRAARAQKDGVLSAFHAADLPMLDPAGPVLAEPAQPQYIASVTTLDLATRIRLCHDETSLMALHASAGTAWTWEHKELADAQALEIKMKEQP